MRRWIAVVAVGAVVLAGCATNRQVCVERQWDPETGNPTNEFEYRQVGAVSWGSHQDEARGELDYQGPDWRLKTGNVAVSQTAGDGTEVLLALFSLAGAIAPMLTAPRTPDGPSPLQSLIEAWITAQAGRTPPSLGAAAPP